MPTARDHSGRLTLDALFSRIEDKAERHTALVLAAWSVIFLLITGLLAATKLLWADELATSYLSQSNSIYDIWQNLLKGADAHPPLSFVLVHLSYLAFGVGRLSSRLPFILGFWTMALCVFFFVQKRCGTLYGVAAMSLPLISAIYPYSYESRPYALVLGSAAAALLSWQRACTNSSAWLKVALLVALLTAISSHFFAVFIWVPLIAGELVRTIRSRKVDRLMWCSILAGLLPLPLYLPIASATAKLYFTTSFWSRPSLGSVGETYRLMLELAETPIVLALVLWAALRRGFKRVDSWHAHLPVHELVAVGLLALFPVYCVAASFLTGAYTERYGIPTIIGLTVGLVFLCWSRTAGDRLLALVSVFVFLSIFVVKQARLIEHQIIDDRSPVFGSAHPFDNQQWVAMATKSTLPLVLSDNVFFTQVEAYIPPTLSGRLFYLTSPSKAIESGFSPAGDTNLLMIDSFLHKIPLASFEEFSVQHRRFLLCVKVDHEGWLPTYLLRSRARLGLQYDEGGHRLFEVFLD